MIRFAYLLPIFAVTSIAAESRSASISLQTSDRQSLSFSITECGDSGSGLSSGAESRAQLLSFADRKQNPQPYWVVTFIVPPGSRAALERAELTPALQGSVNEERREIVLSRPIWVRGMQIGKVIIPANASPDGRAVTNGSAQIEIEFVQVDASPRGYVGDRLTEMIADLAINGEQAKA